MKINQTVVTRISRYIEKIKDFDAILEHHDKPTMGWPMAIGVHYTNGKTVDVLIDRDIVLQAVRENRQREIDAMETEFPGIKYDDKSAEQFDIS